MTNGIDEWVDRHGWKVVTLIVAGTIAWTTLKAQVAGKADRTDVDALRARIEEIAIDAKETRRLLEQQHRYLCRGHEESLGCQP